MGTLKNLRGLFEASEASMQVARDAGGPAQGRATAASRSARERTSRSSRERMGAGSVCFTIMKEMREQAPWGFIMAATTRQGL